MINLRPEYLFFISEKTVSLFILTIVAVSMHSILKKGTGLSCFYEFVLAHILLLINDLLRYTKYFGISPDSPLFISMQYSIRLAILIWGYFMLLLYTGKVYKIEACTNERTVTKAKIIIYNLSLCVSMIPLIFPEIYKYRDYGRMFYKRAGYSVILISLFAIIYCAIYYFSYSAYNNIRDIYSKTLIFAAVYCLFIVIGREVGSHYSAIISTSGALTVLWYYLSVINVRNFTDELTELNNMASFDKYLSKFYEEIYDVSNDPLQVMIFQINGIDSINSAKGFKAGDIFIKKFAEILKKVAKTSRTDLFIGRLSGSKFVIATCTSNRNELEEIQRDIYEQFEHMRINLCGPECIDLKYGHTVSSIAENEKLIYKFALANMHEIDY